MLTRPIVRVALFFVLAGVAYVVAVRFLYPGYFAPFSAFHSDMYLPVDMVARGVTFGQLLHWPRPVYWLTLLAGGHLGFKGSLAFFTLIVLAALAVSMAIVERFWIGSAIPWWLAFVAFLFVAVGPAWYFEPGLDVAYSLAFLFGALGIYAWESRSRERPATGVVLTAAFFVLSALSKESFLPAMIVYGLAAAVRERRTPLEALTIAGLPLAAAAIGFADAQAVHSPFVTVQSPASNPYFVDLSLPSMWALFQYYVAPFANWLVAIFLAAMLAGAWVNRRLPLALTVFAAAILMYLPYTVLPNHRVYYYHCVALPLLALLLPIGWGSTNDATERVKRNLLVARASIAITALIAIKTIVSGDRSDYEFSWGLQQQNVNRNLLRAAYSVQPQIAQAQAVLLRGLDYPFHLWSYPAFPSDALHYTGVWTLVREPHSVPIADEVQGRQISAADVRAGDYDLVLTFDADGKLAGTMRHQMRAVHRVVPQVAVVASAVPAPVVNGMAFPGGLVRPRDAAGAQMEGVYTTGPGEQCCFLAGTASLVLEKPRGAKTAIFTFYVPDFAPFHDRPQRITLALDGIALAPVAVPIGLHDVRFTLPAQLENQSRLSASLTMGTTFVPSELGINADPRRLSVLMTGVRYE